MKQKHCRTGILLLLLSLLVWGATGCSTVPVTNRKQLSLVSTEQEMQLGLASFDQMKQEVPISKDPAANTLVQKVGKRIAAVAGPDLPNAQWEFVVFESKEANAFCLPGGKIGVYTGILPITKDENGLATVLGHEVAHAAAHHGGERMSRALVLQGVEQAVQAGVSNFDPKWQAAAALAYGVGAQVGVELPFSREQESEADHIGLVYMARAGYDPRAALDFWQRFAAAMPQQSGFLQKFLSTHPVTPVRIEQLQKEMPEALAEYQKAKAK